MRRAALTFVSIGALITGVAATAASLKGVADPGVTGGNAGDEVTVVTRSGFAWMAGIRSGQIIDVLTSTDGADDWFLKTHDSNGNYEASAARANKRLRDVLVLAVGSLAFAYLSVVFLRTRRRWVLPTATLAVFLAAIPLQFQASPTSSTVALGASAFLPVAALTTRLIRWSVIRWAATAIAAALVGGWALARLEGWPSYEVAEGVRASVALWGTLVLVGERVLMSSVTSQSPGVMRPRLFDVVVVAGAVALAILAGAVMTLDPATVVVVVIVLLGAVSTIRQRATNPLERFILGDVREQAAAEASEAERARLARELHDVPLQELAAVIRRLEILPGAEAESEDLRALAGHLRNVATELRPPVLDDLGLPAALEFLAGEATTETLTVRATVVDDTGFGIDRRPPGEVELAMFRIASEAVGNAVRHSGGTSVEVRARVAPDRVELAVSDDGAGLAPEAAREAARQKRLGLASMRRRAEAIDAELSIAGSDRGTHVRVVWQA